MLQVLLILPETHTSIVLYTDMNTDIGANINIAKEITSLVTYICISSSIVVHIASNTNLNASINTINKRNCIQKYTNIKTHTNANIGECWYLNEC